MSDYAPPSGPPPPKVPEGWKAQWNDQYKEWFYVNIYTKMSQWDRPTSPVYPPPAGDPDAPPSYQPGSAGPLAPEKSGLSSNNPFGPGGPGGSSSHQDLSEDERLARQLQEEENARGGGASRGEADSFYNQSGAGGQYGQQPQHFSDQLPPRPDETSRGKGKGFLGKLLGGKSPKPQYGQQSQYGQQYPQQQQSYYQGGPPPGQYGGYPPQQGYYGQPGYGPGPGYGYGPPQQQQQSGRRPGGGLGVGGAAALGVGGGLLGGGDGGGDFGGDF